MIQDDRLPKKEMYILYLEDVPKHRWASKSIGISEDTSKRWRDEDPDFAERCEVALSAWVHKNVKKSSPEFQLERLLSEEFKQRTDVTSGDKPIPILSGISSSLIDNENKTTDSDVQP